MAENKKRPMGEERVMSAKRGGEKNIRKEMDDGLFAGMARTIPGNLLGFSFLLFFRNSKQKKN